MVLYFKNTEESFFFFSHGNCLLVSSFHSFGYSSISRFSFLLFIHIFHLLFFLLKLLLILHFLSALFSGLIILYLLQRDKNPSKKGCLEYDHLPLPMVRLQIWGVWSNTLLPLLQGPLWSEVIVPVKILSMSQIDLFKNYSYSTGILEAI